MYLASSPFKGGKTSDDGEKKGPLEKKGRGEQAVVIQRKEDFDRGAHQIGRRTVLCTSCRLLFLSLCHEGRRVIPLLYKENDH